ncbi:MAG: hypothetical protein JRJ09_01975 [Deltaproteobacteria bacterium]|nr:hypothetical protein [Deltaproteobacteria bacterium]MBW2047285.1 hypothetical protein [Deltaproteobacteria bacterium]MBW2111321.1 hypothetical protein [Deltaproteobacteria bacterium]MBW2353312.1 hypothetical protein [Deltaproteobacteria bacterium]HDZ90822.1 hypothetical protein [Deltaproteobacteria bacterium]
MGKIIDLPVEPKRGDHTLISSKPWEFRRAPWRTPHFIQMLRPLADKLRSSSHGSPVTPPHFSLKGGMACTIQAMYANRGEEEKMRETYYLVGLTDCMINQVNPILRTDILRAMYKKVFALKETLNMHWRGTLDQVLLPIDRRFYDDSAYRAEIRMAGTMEDLYRVIRRGTDEMFDILALEYLFFCPWTGA